jgi:hypothetical protein
MWFYQVVYQTEQGNFTISGIEVEFRNDGLKSHFKGTFTCIVSN